MASPYIVGILSVLLLLTSLFMILLVLIQRGRGGGLAGAFGGMGGQSAFGTRAGDVFTKITVVVAIIFILLASLLGRSMRAAQENADREIGSKFTAGAQSEPEGAESDENVPPLANDIDDGAGSDDDETDVNVPTLSLGDDTPSDETPTSPDSDNSSPSSDAADTEPGETESRSGEGTEEPTSADNSSE